MGRSIRLLRAGVAVACVIAVALLASILAAPAAASARSVAERIVSYDARIAIQSDGSILVAEQVTYDFGSDLRHGIFRVIPVRLRYNGSYDRIYPVEVVERPDVAEVAPRDLGEAAGRHRSDFRWLVRSRGCSLRGRSGTSGSPRRTAGNTERIDETAGEGRRKMAVRSARRDEDDSR